MTDDRSMKECTELGIPELTWHCPEECLDFEVTDQVAPIETDAEQPNLRSVGWPAATQRQRPDTRIHE